jgi:hypothetical protein
MSTRCPAATAPRAAFVVGVLATAASPCAQHDPAAQDVRANAIGEVRDDGGAPWAGAEVVLLSRALPKDPDCAVIDRVTALVDARGRFRAPVLRGRPYTVWAWGPPTADGRAATEARAGVFAQQPVVLQQQRELRRRRLVLAHADRWPEHTLHLHVIDELPDLEVHALAVVDGRVELPPLVAPTATAVVVARRADTAAPITAFEFTAASPAELRIELPERRELACRVLGAGNRELTDAVVLRRLAGLPFTAGRTDAHGLLRLAAPADEVPPRRIATLAVAPDGAFGYGWPPQQAVGGANRSGDDIVVGVARPDGLVVRVIGAGGEPLRGTAAWQALDQDVDAARRGDAWTRTTATDGDGVAVLLGTSGLRAGTAHLLLQEHDLAALPAPWRAGVCPFVFAAFAGADGVGSATAPLQLDLGRLCPVEMAFTDAAGTPVGGVEITLRSLRAGSGAPWHAHQLPPLRADARGRIRLLLPSGRRFAVGAVAGDRALIRAFATGSGDPASPPQRTTFVLTAPCALRGRVVGLPPGEPHTVYAHSFAEGCEWRYEVEAAARPARANEALVVLPATTMEHVRMAALITRRVPVDATGAFVIALPEMDIGELVVELHRRDGTGRGAERMPWKGEPEEPWEWRLRD